jgi:hypothetical protein
MMSNKCGFLPHGRRSYSPAQRCEWKSLMNSMLKRVHGKKCQHNGGRD